MFSVGSHLNLTIKPQSIIIFSISRWVNRGSEIKGPKTIQLINSRARVQVLDQSAPRTLSHNTCGILSFFFLTTTKAPGSHVKTGINIYTYIDVHNLYTHTHICLLILSIYPKQNSCEEYIK